MSSSVSAFQIILSNELQGNTLPVTFGPTANILLSEYEAVGFVSQYDTIIDMVNGGNVSYLSFNAVQSLTTLGSDSFPELFNATPSQFTSSAGYGPLFGNAIIHIERYINPNNSTVFFQSVSNAAIFAQQQNAIISSLTTLPSTIVASQYTTGGISAFAGNSASNLATVAAAFANIGSVIDFQNLAASFSASAILLPLAQQSSPVANLQVNLFGKTIVNPVTGKLYVINAATLQSIVNNPVSADGVVTPTVSQHPLEAPLQVAVNAALSDIGDLDAMCTYLGVSGATAASVFQFTDFLNPTLMFNTATPILMQNLGIVSAGGLTVPNIVDMLQQNLTGATNIQSSAQLANAMSQLQSVDSLSQITAISVLPTSNTISNIGIGVNGLLTVSDVLGSSNIAPVLSNLTTSISSINALPVMANIRADISNLVIGLTTANVPGPLSNGDTFANINSYVLGCTFLINQNANTVNAATNFTSLISDYNLIAQTYNNSVELLPLSGISPGNIVFSNTAAQSFVNDLATYAIDSLGSVNFIQPLIDNSTLVGQAASAVIVDTQNTQVLTNLGLIK
jgi:hypothetical protein